MAFSSSGELYEILGGFLRRAALAPGIGSRLAAIEGGITLVLSDPSATISACVVDGDLEIAFGSSPTGTANSLAMTAATAQGLFTGQATFGGALDRGDLTVDGDLRAMVALVPALALLAAPRYVEDLQGMGRDDLL